MPARVTRIVVVRHGQTDWNVEQRIQGHTDIELNAVGQRQARQLAAALADEELHAVYSSDLRRAWDTAAACAHAHALAVQSAPGLREREFGHFEGLRFADIQARWPDAAQRWRRREPDFAPGDGESLRQFAGRCTQAATRLAERHRGQCILLVAHGGVLDCLYRAAARAALDAPRSWMLANAAINRLLYSDAGFTLVGWNDDRHLAPGLAD